MQNDIVKAAAIFGGALIIAAGVLAIAILVGVAQLGASVEKAGYNAKPFATHVPAQPSYTSTSAPMRVEANVTHSTQHNAPIQVRIVE